MQPYYLTEGWRIGNDDRSFTLERRYTPAEDPQKPNKDLTPYWKPLGYFPSISGALTAFQGVWMRENDLPLPETLVRAQRLAKDVLDAIEKVRQRETGVLTAEP